MNAADDLPAKNNRNGLHQSTERSRFSPPSVNYYLTPSHNAQPLFALYSNAWVVPTLTKPFHGRVTEITWISAPKNRYHPVQNAWRSRLGISPNRQPHNLPGQANFLLRWPYISLAIRFHKIALPPSIPRKRLNSSHLRIKLAKSQYLV